MLHTHAKHDQSSMPSTAFLPRLHHAVRKMRTTLYLMGAVAVLLYYSQPVKSQMQALTLCHFNLNNQSNREE